MKHWAWAVAVVGALYLLTVGVMLRRYNYLFATEDLQLPTWTSSLQDDKSLGLPWTKNLNAPMLEYKQRRIHETPKQTKQNTDNTKLKSPFSTRGETRFETTNKALRNLENDKSYDEDRTLSIEVNVGKWELDVKVDGKEVYHVTMELSDVKYMGKGGMYLLVLHPSTAAVMHMSRHRTFEVSGDAEVMRIIRDVQPGRILILANMHEGFMQLTETVETFLKEQGSRVISDMVMGDRWAWIWTKDGRTWAEGAAFTTQEKNTFVLQGSPVHLHAKLPRLHENASVCSAKFENEWIARRNLTLAMLPIPSDTLTLCREGLETGIPTVIVASTRPLLLNRCLRHLLSVAGSDPKLTLVVADGKPDGSLDEVRDLVALYGVKYIGHDSGGSNVTIRIQRHYKFAFDSAFHTFPWARKVIVLEEDLRVSPDFFSYFGQLAPLMDQDATLYCISAWNDLSNSASLGDPRVVMRSETMAGLGWLLTKDIYEEIIPKWPAHDMYVDWDMWMRLPSQQKGRECLVPEVSRTFHFGKVGAHLTAYFQAKYFSKFPFNQVPNVRLKDLDRLGPESYDRMLKELISRAKHLQGASTNPCQANFLPLNATTSHVLWFKMNEPADNYTFTGIIKCLKLWDLDTRGEHKSVWRIKVHGTPLLLVGWPFSPFTVLKPKEISILQRYDPNVELKDDPVYLLSTPPGSNGS
ncbi:protein O-linked-mannose beta-1,2-N-acetylglucosaminyltransferase 1-like [Penaeus japonicus]|uniref:protein O-linked-mannose beta-1,2-N-acetylglucosaminyltransferase 1-like n=1 Tax=Penaeus japonicus TaxID=27405 RepID=UPI001C70B378|nr:protein O-linked-mannose beta-1,2-N-acetylglucosaminyltransferase 1-like [Penaeus japonicus]